MEVQTLCYSESTGVKTGLVLDHSRALAGEEQPAALEEAVADHLGHLYYQAKPGVLEDQVFHEAADIHHSHHV